MNKFKKSLLRIVMGLVLTVLISGQVLGIYHMTFVTLLDNIIYDTRMRLTMPSGVDDRIVILDIDEKALAHPDLGRWPWGHDKMARIIDTLFEHYKIKMLGYDIVWAEQDKSSGLDVLKKLATNELKSVPEYQRALNEITPQLDHESLFIKAMKDRPIVLGYYFNSNDDALESGSPGDSLLPEGSLEGYQNTMTQWKGFGANLPSFVSQVMLSGHFNPTVDLDGVIRRVPLLAEYKGEYFESLTLSMLRLWSGIESQNPPLTGRMPDRLPGTATVPDVDPSNSKSQVALEGLKVGSTLIPMDSSSNVLVPFRGPRGSFPYVSLSDVFNKSADPNLLKNKIILIGTTAPGLADNRSTPVGGVFPGVEVHANLLAGLLDAKTGAIKANPGFMVAAEFVILALTGSILSIVIAVSTPVVSSVLAIVIASTLSILNVAIWNSGFVMPLASTLLLIALIYIVNMAYGYLVEARSKRQFTELFGQYVPPELVAQMAENPEKYSMEGKKATLTVLFSDVVGFTSISEQLSPKDLAAFINEYLTDMSTVIRSNGGTLDKYIGDAIMAFWGAPVETEQHATSGVLSALMMQKALVKLRQSFKEKGWPNIKIGIGLSSGEMTVGDMGSKVRKAYTVMGDAVNLGSRLEGITRQYGVEILVAEETYKHCTGIVFREIDQVRVKGKENPIKIYQPVGVESEVDEHTHNLINRWDSSLIAYRSQKWDDCENYLNELINDDPQNGLYPIYLERVKLKKLEPIDPNWDGVTKFDTK